MGRKDFLDKRVRIKSTIEPDEYIQLQHVFHEGFTHANSHYVRDDFHKVSSYDATSLYTIAQYLLKKERERLEIEAAEARGDVTTLLRGGRNNKSKRFFR